MNSMLNWYASQPYVLCSFIVVISYNLVVTHLQFRAPDFKLPVSQACLTVVSLS